MRTRSKREIEADTKYTHNYNARYAAYSEGAMKYLEQPLLHPTSNRNTKLTAGAIL